MLKIVPQEDWEVLREYLGDSGVVLIPEEVLDSFPPDKRQLIQNEADGFTDFLSDYDFGGEPEISIDIIHNEGSYAAETIFSGAQDSEDEDY